MPFLPIEISAVRPMAVSLAWIFLVALTAGVACAAEPVRHIGIYVEPF